MPVTIQNSPKSFDRIRVAAGTLNLNNSNLNNERISELEKQIKYLTKEINQ